MNIKEIDSQYVANTYARFPVQLQCGKGSLVWDEDGREYIDMGSGIAVNAFGVADGAWAAAVSAQLGRLQHCSNLYYSEPCALLAERYHMPENTIRTRIHRAKGKLQKLLRKENFYD